MPQRSTGTRSSAASDVYTRQGLQHVRSRVRAAPVYVQRAEDLEEVVPVGVVEDVGDLRALERADAFSGRYHVLGGTLSALDAIGPDELRIPRLLRRVRDENVTEVILALNATIDGQTTAHYIADQLGDVRVSTLAQGVPIGGELDYLDDGTITAALRARKTL